MAKAVGRGDAAKVKAWLRARGHAVERVEKIKASSGAELRRGVLELHGVSVAEWRLAGGGVL